MRLGTLYRWFQEVATHPGGVAAGAGSSAALADAPGGVGTVVTPSGEMTAEERVGVYANMYEWRLVEILAEDFPTTRHALGAEEFGAQARAYVAAHPSTSFTLSAYGAAFPGFLRDEASDVPHRDLVAEVAAMERAMEVVFDAPHVEALAVDEVMAVPPDDWVTTALRTIPALRLVDTRYPVDEYLRAVRAGDDPPLPGPGPRPAHTVVWRRRWRVWRTGLSPAQHSILSALAEGRTLGEALAAAAGDPDAPGAGLADVGAWFQEWTREGMFARLERQGA